MTTKKTEAQIEAELSAQEKSLRQQLAEMPKEKIIIPDDPQNPNDVVPIGWNGIVYAVPRGREFEVPSVIAEIWRESYTKTRAAQQKMTITERRDIGIVVSG